MNDFIVLPLLWSFVILYVMCNSYSFYLVLPRNVNKITNFSNLRQAAEKHFSVSAFCGAFWIIKMFTITEGNGCIWNAGAHHQKQAKLCCTLGGSTFQPTYSSPFWHKEKSWWALRCHPKCKLNCLHLSLFFPATEAWKGYLIGFNIVGERPTEEQQTCPWTLMVHQADAPPVPQAAWPLACSLPQQTPLLCSASARGRMQLPQWGFRTSRRPVGSSTSTHPETGQEKESISKVGNGVTGADEPTMGLAFCWRYDVNVVFSKVS